MSPRRPDTIRHRTELFYEAVAIIEREHATELSLDVVSHRLAVSPRQLQRAFAEIGNTSFRAQVTRARMSQAAELLGETPLPVREVAASVRYRQQAQFAKAFRRQFGMSPTRYRAAAQRAKEMSHTARRPRLAA